MFRSFAAFLIGNRRALLFGVACAFLSSPGQTFFIAQFTPAFGRDLDLSATALGSLYLGATLGAATLLPIFGPWIDRIDLRYYVALVAAGLALACGIAAIARDATSLFVAFLFLRLTGQGLMPHAGITSVARHFVGERGRALSITSTGFSIAEGTMPFVAALMIVHLGWRTSYMAVGLAMLVCAAPALYWLAASMPGFSRPPGSDRSSPRPRARDALRVLSRSRFFQGVLPIICFMPFAGTAFVFHIQALAGMRGWSSELVAAAFGAYAMSHAAALLASGVFIDRFGARRLLPAMVAPMLAGLAILASFTGPAALILFLALMGATSGVVQTTTSAAWAEVYGVTRLGAIRSLIVMITVAASALGPAALGAALDAGASLSMISLGTLVIGALSSILAIWAVTQDRSATASSSSE
jgi:MFS family permease